MQHGAPRRQVNRPKMRLIVQQRVLGERGRMHDRGPRTVEFVEVDLGGGFSPVGAAHGAVRESGVVLDADSIMDGDMGGAGAPAASASGSTAPEALSAMPSAALRPGSGGWSSPPQLTLEESAESSMSIKKKGKACCAIL